MISQTFPSMKKAVSGNAIWQPWIMLGLGPKSRRRSSLNLIFFTRFFWPIRIIESGLFKRSNGDWSLPLDVVCKSYSLGVLKRDSSWCISGPSLSLSNSNSPILVSSPWSICLKPRDCVLSLPFRLQTKQVHVTLDSFRYSWGFWKSSS